MTAAERAHLRRLFTWARSAGVIAVGLKPSDPVWRPKSIAGWRVSRHRLFDGISIARGLLESPVDYRCRSITEAVDLLVVFGIVPARFSTAYRFGWDACDDDHEVPNFGAEYRAVVPAHPRTIRPESELAA